MGGGKTKAPPIIFDMAKWEEFVRVWQSSTSAQEACKRLGIPIHIARSKAAALRKLGVELFKFTGRSQKLTSAEIGRLKSIARQTVMNRTTVAAGK